MILYVLVLALLMKNPAMTPGSAGFCNGSSYQPPTDYAGGSVSNAVTTGYKIIAAFSFTLPSTPFNSI